MTIAPDFRQCVGAAEKWIVRRHAAVVVKTQNLASVIGKLLCSVLMVPVADCDVLFVFPNGGLGVSPGQVCSIGLRGGSLFGWK